MQRESVVKRRFRVFIEWLKFRKHHFYGMGSIFLVISAVLYNPWVEMAEVEIQGSDIECRGFGANNKIYIVVNKNQKNYISALSVDVCEGIKERYSEKELVLFVKDYENRSSIKSIRYGGMSVFSSAGFYFIASLWWTGFLWVIGINIYKRINIA